MLPFDLSGYISMMAEVLPWLGPAFVVAALSTTIWWFSNGPSKRTRIQIEGIVRAKGLKLISIKPKPELRFGKSSRCLLAVRVENPFGNDQTLYFDVDMWADLFIAHPNVRELGSGLSPTRFFLSN